MELQHGMAEALLASMSEAMYVVDKRRIITYWNRAAEALTGYPAEQVVGRPCRDGILNHVDDDGRLLCKTGCPLRATIRDGQPRQADVYLHHRDGHRVPVALRSAALRDSAGNITGAVEVFNDDTRYRTLASQYAEAAHLALTDPLTGLPNRRLMQRELRRHHDENRRYGRLYAVLFADIDHFKTVNDLYGHDAGDEVLQMVAATLQACTRPSDTIGRWGGDEFLILTPAAHLDAARTAADRIRRLVAAAWTQIAATRTQVTLSVGVALARPDEPTRSLIDRADTAMLTAKNGGRNQTAAAAD